MHQFRSLVYRGQTAQQDRRWVECGCSADAVSWPCPEYLRIICFHLPTIDIIDENV